MQTDTRDQVENIRADLLQKWEALLQPEQFADISRAMTQFPAGRVEETEEIVFAVSESGEVTESREVRSNSSVSLKITTPHGISVPLKLAQMREEVRQSGNPESIRLPGKN